MANVYKVLGQAAPSATTETTLGTVPSLKNWATSSLVACNRGATNATIRVSVSVGGGATANKDYILYDVTVNANQSVFYTVGLTMNASDIIRVYASTANLSFSLFGDEIS